MDLHASLHWRQVDFISDLHLQAAEPGTHAAWLRYMNGTSADAIFILGDLFEVWVGDDVLADPGAFESSCARAMHHTSMRVPVYIMRGNRDFLIGQTFAAACNAQLLPDPTVLAFAGQRILMTHGDALCLEDHAYQAFRRTVRSQPWQRDFLAKPLADRQDIAADLRARSEAQKLADATYADVDSFAAAQLLREFSAGVMVHGHTHRPAMHDLSGGNARWVLSDWHIQGVDARAEVLRLQVQPQQTQATFTRLSPDQALG